MRECDLLISARYIVTRNEEREYPSLVREDHDLGGWLRRFLPSRAGPA